MNVGNQVVSARLERYRSVVEVIAEQPYFELDDVKLRCAHETPAFITRFINQLHDDGWLVREQATKPSFTWQRRPDELLTSNWLEQKFCGLTVNSAPASDRPRERLLAYGARSLKLSELVAILIRTGRQGESAVQAGERVVEAFKEKMDKLLDALPGELKEVSSVIANTAYCQIMAGIELGRRITEIKHLNRAPTKIKSTADAIAFCQSRFYRLAHDSTKEEFHIVTLDTKNQVIDTHQVSVGTLDASLVHPREVFRAAIKDAASSILLVHNHPSGDPTPSREDQAVTDRLEEGGTVLGIRVLDHIIVTPFRCVSLKECN